MIDRVPYGMRLMVNGEEQQHNEGLTVEGLVESLGLEKSICAVEVNKAVVPRSDRATRVLAEGDTVEVVTLVGGG